MRILRSMHATAAAIVLMALLAIAVCSGMAAPGMAQSMPSNCPLHPHHGQPVDQPASCCAASPRGEAVTESQVRLPDLAIIGNAPQLPVVQHVFFAAATTQPTAVEPPPPRLIALRI